MKRILVVQYWYKDVPNDLEVDEAKELLDALVAAEAPLKEMGWVSGGSRGDGIQPLPEEGAHNTEEPVRMYYAEKILRLIETAVPGDATILEEIDDRVLCYIAQAELLPIGTSDNPGFPLMRWSDGTTTILPPRPSYTSSRDALKMIRPNGFVFDMTCRVGGYDCLAYDNREGMPLWKSYEDWIGGAGNQYLIPTEELAELHAIIQAIEYERTHK